MFQEVLVLGLCLVLDPLVILQDPEDIVQGKS